jgi:hypothetical protein
MLSQTTTRVQRNTAEAINQRIAQETEERIRHYAAHPQQIDRRLRELDAEWDMERTLETNAAVIALLGTVISVINKRFLLLPAVVTGFLLQHALQGWCPPVPLFRMRGVRTATEIERERYALKALRGDFQPISRNADNDHAAATALRAVRA